MVVGNVAVRMLGVVSLMVRVVTGEMLYPMETPRTRTTKTSATETRRVLLSCKFGLTRVEND